MTDESITPEDKELFERCADCRILPMIAHDFNNLLAVTVGFGESMCFKEATAGTLQKFRDLLMLKAKTLAEMATTIMDMDARGGMKLTLTWIEPRLLVESSLELLAPSIRLRVRVHMTGDLPRILVDVNRLKGVFVNIIDNAVKYSTEGSSIDLSGIRTGNDVAFSIKNWGRIIDGDDAVNAFLFGFRSSVDADKPGHGLGLFIARRIIDAHNGDIWFTPAPGVGTIVFIRLPINHVHIDNEGK